MAAQSKTATVIGWILQVWLAVVFFFAGGAKLAGAAPAVHMYDAIGWGQWFRYVTGAIEVGSAILLLVPAVTVLGALLLTCTMVGAVVAHLTVLHSPPTGPVALILLSGAIIWIRREFSLRTSWRTSVNVSMKSPLAFRDSTEPFAVRVDPVAPRSTN